MPGPRFRVLETLTRLARAAMSAKTLTAVALAIIAAICALGISVIAETKREAWREAGGASANLATAIERDVGRNINMLALSLDGMVRALALPGIDAVDPAIRHMALFDNSATAEFLGSMLLLDENGDIILESTSLRPRRLNLGDRDYFTAQRDGTGADVYVSAPFRSRLPGNALSIGVSRRVSRQDGSFAGVAVGAMHVAYFNALFSTMDVGPHGTISVIRDDGQVLAHYPAGDVTASQGDAANVGVFRAVHSGQITVRSPVDGLFRQMTFRQIGTYPLYVVVSRSAADIDATWWGRAATIGIVIAALCGSVVWLGYLFQRELANRRTLDQAKAKAEAEYRLLVSSVQDYSICTLDADGRIVTWNAGAEKIEGYTADEILGHSVKALYAPEAVSQARAEHDLEAAAKTGRAESEGWQLHRSGMPFWANAVITAMRDPRGRLIGFSRITRDLSERKRAESGLIEAAAAASMARDEAHRANRAKSEFLANMSHEIRTPMNGIIGMTDLLLRTGLAGPQHRFAQAIQQSAEVLLKLINNILDISKLESEKVELEDVDFTVAECVSQTMLLLGTTAERKRLALTADLQPVAYQMVRGDPVRLGQVIQNLLANAVKFTDSGSVLLVVGGEADGAGKVRLRIEVHDTGCGFDEAARTKLFQTFQQADGSITRRFGGSGLGLALCKQIVDLMGGRLGAESEPGVGSQFWVELTLDEGTAPPPRRLAPASAVAGRRVLLVDDTPVNRLVFEGYLVEAGMLVGTAETAATALAMVLDAAARGAPFELVVTDHDMPEMNGPTLARVIRSKLGDRSPALVLVSSVDLPARSDPDRAPFAACLAKPLRGADLVDCLQRVLAAPRPGQPPAGPVARHPAARHLARPPADGARVLFVDDNEVNRLLGITLLEQAGYAVTSARDGGEALRAAEAASFDVVFMDVQMPVLDGIEATRRIRALPGAACAVPIVALTANAMVGDRERLLAAGMNDYLSKPLDPEEFLAVAARWAGVGLAAGTPTDPPADAPPAEPPPPTRLADIRAQPVLDEAGLRQLQGMLPPAAFLRIIETFIATRFFDDLSPQPLATDLPALGRQAHTCRGTSASLGASRLRLVSELIERACEAGDVAEVRALLPEAAEVMATTRLAMAAISAAAVQPTPAA